MSVTVGWVQGNGSIIAAASRADRASTKAPAAEDSFETV
jgi:hypothetical protein